MKRRLLAVAAGTALTGLLGITPNGMAASANSGTEERTAPTGPSAAYTIGLFGDVPYGEEGRTEFPALRADMNRANLRFSLFNGDLKSGSERCDDALYHQSKARFNRFTSPVVVVPGDNDWTDCHRENNGSYDPLERLAYERKVFYSTPYSFGRVALRVQRQPGYPENALFGWSPVTYVGLNVQGSNNNLPHAGVGGEDRPAAEIAQMHAEYNAREAANERWLTQAFDRAKARKDKAVLIWWQADPNFNNEMKLTDPREYNGFTAITAALRKQVLHFSGQVVLVHGDSHYFRIDKPLMDDDGRVVSNFTRVETFGEADTDWVSATVSPEDPNVFTFRPQIVPG